MYRNGTEQLWLLKGGAVLDFNCAEQQFFYLIFRGNFLTKINFGSHGPKDDAADLTV